MTDNQAPVDDCIDPTGADCADYCNWSDGTNYGAFEQIYPVLQEFKKVSAQADDDE